MLVNEVITGGAVPVLEATIAFAGQRQRVLSHNVANWETPLFQPVGASPTAFREALREAVEERRATRGGMGELVIPPGGGVERRADGTLRLVAGEADEGRTGVLQHDRNNSDLERMMQDVVENLGTFRAASDLLRSRTMQMNAAISERV